MTELVGNMQDSNKFLSEYISLRSAHHKEMEDLHKGYKADLAAQKKELKQDYSDSLAYREKMTADREELTNKMIADREELTRKMIADHEKAIARLQQQLNEEITNNKTLCNKIAQQNIKLEEYDNVLSTKAIGFSRHHVLSKIDKDMISYAKHELKLPGGSNDSTIRMELARHMLSKNITETELVRNINSAMGNAVPAGRPPKRARPSCDPPPMHRVPWPASHSALDPPH